MVVRRIIGYGYFKASRNGNENLWVSAHLAAKI
jgi:hypothetical protein